MNTQMTVTAPATKLTPVEAFLGAVLRPQDRVDIERGLPKHIPYDRFERNLTNAVMNNPKLLECKPREVFREVAKIAALGLILDPQLGEAYLITGFGKSGPTPQVRVGYRGLIKLARQSGDVASIYAHEVHQNDEFSVELGTEKRLYHKPNIFGDRGEVVGFYAAIQYKDGDTDFEPMSIKQIEAIRNSSDAWKGAVKYSKTDSTPWGAHFSEMAKKTCIRRLLKRAPQSPDLNTAIRYDEDGEAVQAARQIAPRASHALAAPAAATEAAGVDQGAHDEPDASGAPPRASQATPDHVDEIDWDQQLESYDNTLSACETLEHLNEGVSQMGSVFADAPPAVQDEARKLEEANRARIERLA